MSGSNSERVAVATASARSDFGRISEEEGEIASLAKAGDSVFISMSTDWGWEENGRGPNTPNTAWCCKLECEFARRPGRPPLRRVALPPLRWLRARAAAGKPYAIRQGQSASRRFRRVAPTTALP